MRPVPSANALPLTLGLQGVALALLAFLLAPPSPSKLSSATGGAGGLASSAAPVSADILLPRDLIRDPLPVPRFPDVDSPEEAPAPNPQPKSPEKAIVDGTRLDSLRVSSVTLASLASVDAPVPFPDAPDFLDPNEISAGRSWLGESRGARQGSGAYAGPSDTGRGPGGWGGTGIGGSGHGTGGDCPTPGAVGRPGGGRGRPVETTAGSPGGGGRGTAGPPPEGVPRGRPTEGRGPDRKGGGRTKGSSKN